MAVVLWLTASAAVAVLVLSWGMASGRFAAAGVLLAAGESILLYAAGRTAPQSDLAFGLALFLWLSIAAVMAATGAIRALACRGAG